jgi:hypothetical protein
MKPTVEELESRESPSLLPYTETVQVIAPDHSFQNVTESFVWDTDDPVYTNAVGEFNPAAAQQASAVDAVNAAASSADADGVYDLAAVNACCEALDAAYASASSAFGDTIHLNGTGINGWYSNYSGTVTIDSSVHDDASAKARCDAIFAAVKTAEARNTEILNSIQGSWLVPAVAKCMWYKNESNDIANFCSRAKTELQLISVAYPNVIAVKPPPGGMGH